MKFFAKTYRTQGELLVAACDKDLLGKIFSEGKLVLDVRREFYGTDLVKWEALSSLLRAATIANLVGESAVSKAIESGFIEKGNVLRVKGVPHAQMVRI